MKWIWDGGFRAHKQNEDGTATELVFTSSAQARQHVEKHENVILAVKHQPPRKGSRNRVRRGGVSTPITRLNEQQAKLKAEALKMTQGL
jgi:hypothetical protein